MIPSEAKAPWKSLNEKMAKVSIELDGVAISCANRGAVSALPSKIADTNCSAYLCVIVIARESESEPVVHHNREIGKH